MPAKQPKKAPVKATPKPATQPAAKPVVTASPRKEQFRGSISLEDIKALVEIDPNRLDMELQRQASTFLRFALAAAEGKRELAEAKNRMEVVRVKCASDIRETPELYGIMKSTEGSISEAVLSQPAYQEAIKEYNDVKFHCDQLDAAVTAMDHKKRVIQGYISLYGQGWFAEPNAGNADSRKAAEQMMKIGARNLPLPQED